MAQFRLQIVLDGNAPSCSLLWKLLADTVVFVPRGYTEQAGARPSWNEVRVIHDLRAPNVRGNRAGAQGAPLPQRVG